MFTPFERLIAWRYLRSRKEEGFVSLTAGFSFMGIMLGVATLIIVMSVMNGFRQELFSRILGLNGHLNVYSLNGPLYDYDQYVQRVLSVAGVRDVTPLVEGQALASSRGQASGVMVRGIEWKDFVNRDLLRDSVHAGSTDDFQGNVVAIGTKIAERMGLVIGDSIVLTSPDVKSTPFGSIPRQRSYRIALIFDVGMYEYNNGYLFMPLPTAQKFFKMKDSVKSLEVFLNDPDQIDNVREAINLSLGGQIGVYDWRDMNKSFFNALNVERNVMFLILSMIILVAAFNIISSMIMLVKDKGQDIAIMRTMGATRANMMRIFMLTGASIGFIGTAIGSILGISFALNIETIKDVLEGLTGAFLWDAEIRFLSEIPAEIDWDEVIVVIGMAFLLSILATIYPAWRAARLDPVEALRYE